MKAVAVTISMAWPGGEVESDPCEDQARTRLVAFRSELHSCFGRRADALSELTDAMLCADGPVRAGLAAERADRVALGFLLLGGRDRGPAAAAGRGPRRRHRGAGQ